MYPAPPKLQPAFFGGLFIGVLSTLPIVGWLNACCCLWVLSGGVLALWLLQSNHPYPVTAADGALVGLLAGLVGGVIAIPLNLVFESFQRQLLLRFLDTTKVEIPPQFRSMFETRPGPLVTIFNGLFSTVVYAVFAMFGGLIGVALFKKKDAPPPPPPPPAGTVDILPPEPPAF
jgi:hypothetical protein